MLGWLRREIAWRREHKSAWSGVAEPGDDGLSSFQRDCLAALARGCARCDWPLPTTESRGATERDLVGQLPDGREFFIYVDGAQIGDRPLEQWDYRTPRELCDAFAEGVVDRNFGAVAV